MDTEVIEMIQGMVQVGGNSAVKVVVMIYLVQLLKAVAAVFGVVLVVKTIMGTMLKLYRPKNIM